MTITATHDQVREADNAELVMLAYWRTCLKNGTSPQLVESLIVSAVDYQPLLGLPMDVCNNPTCHTWVEEDARDEHGDLYCSEGCADDASHAAEERRYAQALYRLGGPDLEEAS